MDAATTAITTITTAGSSHHQLHQPLLQPPLRLLYSQESGGPRDRGGVNARPLLESLGSERRHYGKGRAGQGREQRPGKGEERGAAGGGERTLPERAGAGTTERGERLQALPEKGRAQTLLEAGGTGTTERESTGVPGGASAGVAGGDREGALVH